MKTLAERHTGRHFSVMEVLRWLDCGHLPPHLREIADIITAASDGLLDRLEDGPQLTRGLHALVEAKDCFVRQAVLDQERRT
jgi:ferritin-like protein